MHEPADPGPEPGVFTFSYPVMSGAGPATREKTVVAENADVALAEAIRQVNDKRDRGFVTTEDVQLVGQWPSRAEYEQAHVATPGPRGATGLVTVLSSGFTAVGDANQSDGRGGKIQYGDFATYAEALAASRGKGVQGDDGEVRAYRWVQWTGGKVECQSRTVRQRRRDPNSESPSYTVGLVVDEALLNDANNFFED